jgi:hypothetical protein
MYQFVHCLCHVYEHLTALGLDAILAGGACEIALCSRVTAFAHGC